MSAIEKTIEQIREESDRSYNEFLKELKEIREYQSKHKIVKEYPGGLTIDRGSNRNFSKTNSK